MADLAGQPYLASDRATVAGRAALPGISLALNDFGPTNNDFGPTNIVLWRLAVGIELGEGGREDDASPKTHLLSDPRPRGLSL